MPFTRLWPYGGPGHRRGSFAGKEEAGGIGGLFNAFLALLGVGH